MRIGAMAKAVYVAAFFGVSILVVALLSTPPTVSAEEVDGEVRNIFAVDEEEAVTTEELEDESVFEEEEVPMPTGDDAFVDETEKYTVSPVVTNEKVKPRDIVKKELVVTNNLDRRVDLYISVENIDPTEGSQDIESPAVADLSTSLANWVEITRGVIELGPYESRKIPYLIHVNLSAKPGNYFARIQFRDGARRSDAEAKDEGAALLLNVEVMDDANERLQLSGFVSEDSLVLGDTVSFSYLLENVGNRLIEPRGSIRIFNRRGEEVGSIPLNADGEEINPENKRQLAAAWSAAGRFGKYKAFLDLEYGESQLASVQDTVYFWVFPWKEILASLAGVFVLAIIGTYIVHMRAVAQPVRVRSTPRIPEIQVEEPVAPSPMPQSPQSTYPIPSSPRATQSQQQTVLLGSRKAQTATPQVNPGRKASQGATVELTQRDAGQTNHARPQTYGSTVQLSRRQQ